MIKSILPSSFHLSHVSFNHMLIIVGLLGLLAEASFLFVLDNMSRQDLSYASSQECKLLDPIR